MDDNDIKTSGFQGLKQKSKTFGGINSAKHRPRRALDSLSEEELHHHKEATRGSNKSLSNYFNDLPPARFKDEMEAMDLKNKSEEQDHENGDSEWEAYLGKMQTLEQQRRMERTAMGEYVPPDGGKPLTQLAVPVPGPADYCPTMLLNKPSAPHYSLGGKTKYSPVEVVPGANRYKTELDLNWKEKKITLKGRGKPVGIVPEGNDWKKSVGPAKYDVKNGNFGTIAPKYDIALSRKDKEDTGPPRRLVHPVDTLGFDTPGPAKYRPSSSYWGRGVEQSFGLPYKKRESDVPGPGEYDIPEPDHRPIYPFGMSLNPICYAPGSHTPGPGAYKIGTTIGQSPATTLLSRHPEIRKDNTPAPNTYILPAYAAGKPKYSMTYRTFERAVTPTPAPGQYDVSSKDNIRKEGPAFTCRQKLRHPSILHLFKHTTEIPTQKSDVSPNSYDPNRDFSKNDKPRYSIGKRIKEQINNNPGPATYNIMKNNKFEGRAFSIRKAVERNPAKIGPGPAAYNPKRPSGPSYSMSGWNGKGKERSSAPAANTYVLRSNQTRTGTKQGPAASLKGRPSPYIYSGFKRPVRA